MDQWEWQPKRFPKGQALPCSPAGAKPCSGGRPARLTDPLPCKPRFLVKHSAKQRSQLLDPRLLASSKDARHNADFVESSIYKLRPARTAHRGCWKGRAAKGNGKRKSKNGKKRREKRGEKGERGERDNREKREKEKSQSWCLWIAALHHQSCMRHFYGTSLILTCSSLQF